MQEKRSQAASRSSTPTGGISGDSPVEPRLRVCVLAACPFPANHGTPGSIRELSEAIAERGHEVHIVTYHMGQDISLRGVHLHRVKPLLKESTVTVGPTSRRPLYDLQMVFEAIRVVREHKIDLIHAHGYEAALIATLVRAATWRPFLYSAHNTMGDELASYDFFRWKWMANSLAWSLDTVVPRLGNWAIPHTEAMRRFLLERGLKNRCERVVNFGVELQSDEDAPAPHPLAPELADDPVVMYTGVMDHFQRLDLLLEAMAIVVRTAPQAKLVMVTTIENEAHQQRLADQAESLGIRQNVIFTEPQDLSRVKQLLRHCDVAVVSRPGAPGFPVKLLNYMAASRACAMYESSADGITHGEHALLASEDTAESLAGAIIELLEDPDLRERLGRNGHDYVHAEHDRRHAATRVIDAYNRALRATGRWERLKDRPEICVDVHQEPASPRETGVTENAPAEDSAAIPA